MNTIYQYMTERVSMGEPMLAALFDPEKNDAGQLQCFISAVLKARPQFVFVGGSQLQSSVDEVVIALKQKVNVPIVLFPGNVMQLSAHVDALLMLTLISGRNPDFLIGQQVQAAPIIRRMRVETIATGYILVEGGTCSAVQRVSGTQPLRTATDIVATAIAGEMMGQQLIYLEAGSGAAQPISPDIIAQVRAQVSVPLIVGGGMCTPEAVRRAVQAGADIVVVGNHFEQHPDEMESFVKAMRPRSNAMHL